MAAPSPSWNLVRVYGTWHKQDGSLRPGKFKVTVPVRVTNSTDDTIIPAGVYASGDLQTADPLEPSLDVLVPATDDPDNEQTGWKLQVDVTFPDASAEKYVLEVPVADRPVDDGGTGNGVNLRTVALSQNLPTQQANYRVGVPGGLARLNNDGQVVDADGNPVTGEGEPGEPGPPGEGVPEGGLTGQVLAKASSTDYDTEWIDPPEGGSDGGGGGPVEWDDVQNKPSEFTPSSHTHDQADVTGLTAALAGKSDTSHTHHDWYYTETEVDNLLDGKADDEHTHAQADVTGLTTALGNLVPKTTKVNGFELTSDVTLDAEDVGAMPAGYTPAVADLPAGMVMFAIFDGEAWPNRPTTREDILVQWVDYTGTAPAGNPAGAVAGVDMVILKADEESV